MDYTLNSHSNNISEDSGYVVGSSLYGTGSSTDYVETPTNILPHVSRKRKLSHDNVRSLYKDIREYETYNESPVVFEKCTVNLLSSTLNESLSRSLEKCNLGTYTPNFYVERSPTLDLEHATKRYKLDDSPKYQPKTRSAPSTPTKHLDAEEVFIKSQSAHLNAAHLPATKSNNHKRNFKLGSPERLELLYPNLVPTASPLKLKTPEKLREFIKKINSPAKKRLFENCPTEDRRIVKKTCYDPILLLSVKNDFRHIISKIFEYLSDRDLCTVSKVSKLWKKALTSDFKAFPRYYTYSREFNSNKENLIFISCKSNGRLSPPSSPVRDSFHRCMQIVSKLLPTQSLQQCIRCMKPAVIQRSVSQCQNPNCEYIYCTKCLSFSITGPENFIDECRTSELLVDTKQKELSRFGLSDISNGGIDLSFFPSGPLTTPDSKYNTSGYSSVSDSSPALRSTPNISSTKRLPVLKNINRTENSMVQKKSRRSSLVPVVSSTSTLEVVEITEPSSPPKVKLVACSKQSKKNLKRLNF